MTADKEKAYDIHKVSYVKIILVECIVIFVWDKRRMFFLIQYMF